MWQDRDMNGSIKYSSLTLQREEHLKMVLGETGLEVVN
jgi:hypothetical protein